LTEKEEDNAQQVYDMKEEEERF